MANRRCDRSKNYRTPHALVQLPVERFQEDLRYDVVVEMELVRPSRGQEEMGQSRHIHSARSVRRSTADLVRQLHAFARIALVS
jgi:hypothetical protein